MVKSRIPRELRVDLVDDGQGNSQWVETRVIDPVSGADQKQVRFLLPQEGILDDAFVSFQVVAPAGEDLNLPLWAGAMSAFDTATLMCGGEQIAQSRGIAHLWTLKNFYRNPQNRDRKWSKRVGNNTSLMVDYLEGETNVPAGGGVWGTDVNQDYVTEVNDDARATTTGYKITDSEATSPFWEVSLAELFPVLYQNNLPLGLLKDSVSVIFSLTQEQTRGDRTCATSTGWKTGTNYKNWRLHADLVFYEDDIGQETTMDRLQKKLDAGLQIPFTDYTYILQNQPAAAPATSNQKVNTLLGLDNQVVRRLFVSTPPTPNYSAPASSGNALLGNYCSQGSNKQNTLQVTINSEPWFPNQLNTDGKLQNQLSQAFPTPHKINQAIQSAVGQVDTAGAYSATKQQLTDKTLNGMKQDLQAGYGHYYGVGLSRTFANVNGAGTPVGRQSVLLEMEDQRCTTGNLAKQVHIWAECERNLLMANGKVLVVGA